MKNAILMLFVVFTLSACGSIKDAWNADSNIKKVELGMTKRQVVDIMGTSYDAIGARRSYRGRAVESIGYAITQTDMYIFNFEDGKLVEWYKDKIQLPNQNARVSE